MQIHQTESDPAWLQDVLHAMAVDDATAARDDACRMRDVARVVHDQALRDMSMAVAEWGRAEGAARVRLRRFTRAAIWRWRRHVRNCAEAEAVCRRAELQLAGLTVPALREHGE
jgi:hypothetical protein